MRRILKKSMSDFYIRYKNYIAINRELDKMNIAHVNLVNYAKKIKQLDLYNFIKNPDIYEKQNIYEQRTFMAVERILPF